MECIYVMETKSKQLDGSARGIRHVTDWFYQHDELDQTYNPFTNNCKHFTSRLQAKAPGSPLGALCAQ